MDKNLLMDKKPFMPMETCLKQNWEGQFSNFRNEFKRFFFNYVEKYKQSIYENPVLRSYVHFKTEIKNGGIPSCN